MTRYISKTLTTAEVEQITVTDLEYKYVLFAKFNVDTWVCLYEGDSYSTALAKTDFWDERLDVNLLTIEDLQQKHITTLKNKIESQGLNPDSEVGRSLLNQFLRIEKAADEATKKFDYPEYMTR